MRQGRKPFVDESGDYAGAEATGGEQLWRQATAASGHEHGESKLLCSALNVGDIIATSLAGCCGTSEAPALCGRQ